MNPSEFCRKSEEEARERIVRLLNQQNYRPVLVGEMALNIGPLWSLASTEELVETMVAEGHLRKASEDEVQRFSREGFYLVK